MREVNQQSSRRGRFGFTILESFIVLGILVILTMVIIALIKKNSEPEGGASEKVEKVEQAEPGKPDS